MATQSVCAKCHGTGWIIIERANVSGAEPCECRAVGRVDRSLERAQIPVNYFDASFENFVAHNPNLKGAMNEVRAYVDAYPRCSPPGLLLIGDPGTGKTHLAVAALRRLIERNREGVFWDYQTLLDRIRSGYDTNSNSTDKEAYRSVLDCEILLLDDLGAHRVTDWVQDTVTSIITHRCNNKKPLIATTNLPEAAMQTSGGTTDYRRTLADHIGTRAHSRLFEMCKMVRVRSSDYRRRKELSF